MFPPFKVGFYHSPKNSHADLHLDKHKNHEPQKRGPNTIGIVNPLKYHHYHKRENEKNPKLPCTWQPLPTE